MILYLADLFTRLAKYSAQLDNVALLTNQHWVSIDEITQQKVVYIFRTNNELLISRNGAVQKAQWEYLGNNSLLIDTAEGSQMFKHGFFDDSILALKLDSTQDFSIFVNENKQTGELNSAQKVVQFLETKYLTQRTKQKIENVTGQQLSPARVVITKTKEEMEREKAERIEQERIFREAQESGDVVVKVVYLLFFLLLLFCTIIAVSNK